MALFICLTLTTGNHVHVDTGGVDAEPALKAFGQKAKSGDWIETIEGALINPAHITSAEIVDLPKPPADELQRRRGRPAARIKR